MMYINLIGLGPPGSLHPNPACFGVFSKIAATFSRKRLFGYTSLVWATVCITVLSFIVWLHHFFTIGARERKRLLWYHHNDYRHPDRGEDLNWLFTILSAASCSILRCCGPSVLSSLSRWADHGVLLAVPGADFVLHNSLFLIARFHNVIIGGVVFGCFAGMTYWWPKAFGFKLNETAGKHATGSGSSAYYIIIRCMRWASWA